MAGYALCMAALVGVGLAAIMVLGSLTDALRQRSVHRETLMQLAEIFSALQDAETAQRGFVLTGKSEYLDPYEKAKRQFPLHFEQLRLLTPDQKTSAAIETLHAAAEAKLAHVEQVIAARRNQGFDAASALVNSGTGKQLMDRVRIETEALEHAKASVFSELVTASEQKALLLKYIILVGIPLAIISLFLTGLFLSRHIASPINRLTREADRIAAGDLSTPLELTSRKDEIGRLVRASESMRCALEENRRQLTVRNDSLSALNNQLEELTRTKSEFLAMMSHEIRTPLHGLVGYANLLADTPLDDRQRDYLATIRASGKSLLTVINDVLDFSKIEAGKLEIEHEVFEISRCLRETCELFRPAATENNTELAWRLDPDVPVFAKGDFTRLGQVLSNLVSNAVKFTRGGSVSVHGSRREAPADGGFFLHISVQDDGIGIPLEKRGQLFQSFEQLGASTARKHGGTGLGLAICWRLCDLMGGKIWVDEEITNGTMFHFEVRLAPASEQDMRSTAGLAASAFFRVDAGKLASARVLIAEDNPVNASLLSLYLKKHGLTASVASNGRKAIEMAPDCDLIFMDVQMPEMDGLEATRVIRHANRSHPYIIALTAEATKEDANSCFDAGMDDYLAKPFNQHDLNLAIVKFCNRRADSSR